MPQPGHGRCGLVLQKELQVRSGHGIPPAKQGLGAGRVRRTRSQLRSIFRANREIEAISIQNLEISWDILGILKYLGKLLGYYGISWRQQRSRNTLRVTEKEQRQSAHWSPICHRGSSAWMAPYFASTAGQTGSSVMFITPPGQLDIQEHLLQLSNRLCSRADSS